MIISHKYKFIFIKTQKTAGSSIEKFLISHLGKNDIFAGMPLEGIKSKNCKNIYEHVGAKFIYNNFPNEYENYFKFTIERNPFDKVVSLYYFLKKYYPKKVKLGFNDMILNNKTNRFYKKDWELYTVLDNPVAEIIQYENLHDEFSKICKMLEIPYKNDLKKINLKSNIRKSKNYREYYNNDTKEKVLKFYYKPIKYFGYEF